MAWMCRSHFLALISDQGEITLVPRVGPPILFRHSSNQSSGPMVSLWHKLEFPDPWKGGAKDNKVFSVHAHSSEDKFLCSDGYTLLEYSLEAPSLDNILLSRLQSRNFSSKSLPDLWRIYMVNYDDTGDSYENWNEFIEGLIARSVESILESNTSLDQPGHTMFLALLSSAEWSIPHGR
eukprot:367702_1